MRHGWLVVVAAPAVAAFHFLLCTPFFFCHSLSIFIWFTYLIISQRQPEEGRWEKEQSHRPWLLVAEMQHSCHSWSYNDSLKKSLTNIVFLATWSYTYW
mmetsp:Transcript_7018/g.11044  ORF Transcript_7018/g.11044 Transcript_7018/m.11044 type:complete len:99 (-) Transcript_7018:43-339(-)